MSNNKNNRWLSIVTIILLLANVVTLFMLWSNRNEQSKNAGTPQQMPAQPFEYISKELNLDQSQQEAYKKLRDQHQAVQRLMQDSIRKAKDVFFELLQKPGVSDSLLRVTDKRSTDLVAEMDIITFKHFQQVRELCKPEQQKRFDAIIKEVLHRMSGPRKGPPPGDMHPPGAGHDGPPPPPPGQ